MVDVAAAAALDTDAPRTLVAEATSEPAPENAVVKVVDAWETTEVISVEEDPAAAAPEIVERVVEPPVTSVEPSVVTVDPPETIVVTTPPPPMTPPPKPPEMVERVVEPPVTMVDPSVVIVDPPETMVVTEIPVAGITMAVPPVVVVEIPPAVVVVEADSPAVSVEVEVTGRTVVKVVSTVPPAELVLVNWTTAGSPGVETANPGKVEEWLVTTTVVAEDGAERYAAQMLFAWFTVASASVDF